VVHLRDNGFPVKVEKTTSLTAVKQRYHVPPELESCHTALVESYVVEGHVPADLVDRLLRERPKIAGLAVPGMPAGSPGMEGSGRAERYQIIAFEANGRTRVFASR
jgi:hypothetical protein